MSQQQSLGGGESDSREPYGGSPPAEPGVGSLPYASPIPYTPPEPPPDDTDSGLRIGGAILMVAILLQLSLAFMSTQLKPRRQPQIELPVSPIVVALFVAVIVMPASLGLLAGEDWARWYGLVVVTISGVLTMGVGYFALTARGAAKSADIVSWAVIIAGAMYPVAWLVLLSRPTTGRRVAAGTVLVIGLHVAITVLGFLIPQDALI